MESVLPFNEAEAFEVQFGPSWEDCEFLAGPSAADARQGGGVTGLDHRSTSHTSPFFLFLETQKMRLRRVRQRVRAFIDLAGDVGEIGDVKGKWARVGLTYRPGEWWQPKDIAFYLTKLRNWADRRGFKLVYLWVAELQERGAVHYHIMIKLPKGITVPKPDKSGMWSHGSSCVEWVKLSGKRYMSKYAQKEEQKRGVFPLGLRLCGAGGLSSGVRAWWTWLLSPQYVRQETEPKDLPRRVAGGWRCADGQFIPTPWVATYMPGGVVLRRKSADEWRDCAVDYDPVGTYLRRQSFIDSVAAMWRLRETANGVRYVSPWLPFESEWHMSVCKQVI